MGTTALCPGCGELAELESLEGLSAVVPGAEVLTREIEAIGKRCLPCWKRIALLTSTRAVSEAVAAHPVGRQAFQVMRDWYSGRKAREKKERERT